MLATCSISVFEAVLLRTEIFFMLERSGGGAKLPPPFSAVPCVPTSFNGAKRPPQRAPLGTHGTAGGAKVVAEATADKPLCTGANDLSAFPWRARAQTPTAWRTAQWSTR